MDEVEFSKGIKTLKELSSKFDSSNIIPDQNLYVDGLNKIDARPEMAKAIYNNLVEKHGEDLAKAATIAGAASGTTDKALIPLYVDPRIVDVTRRLTPLIELTPRVSNYGRTAEFDRLTARGVRSFGPETEALTEQDDTYARSSTSIKYCRQVGKVSGPYQAASKFHLKTNYVDALNLEIMNKSRTMRLVEEDTLLNGDSDGSRTAYGGITTTSGYEYDGIRNTSNIQTVAGGSATVTIPKIRQAIREARTADDSSTLGQGNPDMIVTDFKTQDDLKGLLQDYQRFVPQSSIAWGFQTTTFDGLPVIPSRFMPTTTNSRELLALDSSTWQMRVLQDMTYEELAKTDDSYKFMVKIYEALICTAPEYNCAIQSLK